MSEKVSHFSQFDQNYNETEKTFIPKHDRLLDRFLDHSAKTIQQPYLSHPSEPYSLRMRHAAGETSTKIDATLKSRGEIVDTGLSRDEFTAPLTLNRYGYYRNDDLPTVRKRRSSPMESIDIDFYSDGYSHVESEDPAAWQRFLEEFGLSDADFDEVTGEVFTDNEWRAHHAYRREHGGREALLPAPEFDTEVALEAILQYAKSRLRLSRKRVPVVRLFGRSGSGKSHYMQQLRTKLAMLDIPSAVISTDDYNVGMAELTRLGGGAHPTDFDSQEVYDVSAAHSDMTKLLQGDPIYKKEFDFATSESKPGQKLLAPPDNGVLFVEGLWARHETFDQADITLEVKTPIATSIGRRIMRDLLTRPEFAEPASNLGYYLEYAEPAYRSA